MREPWVPVDNVAKHLVVTKDSIYRWIHEQGFGDQDIRRICKFKLSKVDEWVQAIGVGDRAPGEEC
jgi:excisionase family DNA binding protein